MVELVKNNVFEIKNYKDLIKTKSTFFNEILFVINNFYKTIKSPSILISFLVVFLLFIVVKRTSNIESKWNVINGDILYENYQTLKFDIDSINYKMIEWKSLLNKNISLEKNIRNQSYWSALNIKDYSYNLRGGACFGGYNFSIKVQNNQVISITEISSREFDPERKHAKTENYDSNITLDDFIDKYQFNPSINQIFTVFGTILSNNPYHHIIEYDSILKYPKSAFFDFSNCILDEEGCWAIDNLKYDKKSLEVKNNYNHGMLAMYNGC
jgi:hypothetical protein